MFAPAWKVREPINAWHHLWLTSVPPHIGSESSKHRGHAYGRQSSTRGRSLYGYSV